MLTFAVSPAVTLTPRLEANQLAKVAPALTCQCFPRPPTARELHIGARLKTSAERSHASQNRLTSGVESGGVGLG